MKNNTNSSNPAEMTLKEKVEEAVSFIQSQQIDKAELGIILGTGLGALIEEIDVIRTIEYADIPHFPISTVEFHDGRLVYGILSGKKVLAMQGRFHYYEGYSMREVTFPIYVLKLLGIRHMLISNAAGSLNSDWKKGELMLIDDHINLLPENPLRGKNNAFFGPRYPDMSTPYNKRLNELAQKLAEHHKIPLRKGVYVAVQGPNLETRAEYRYLRQIGADAVGMSTVPEVIVANYLGLSTCAISVLTDDCDPDNLQPANIEEIIGIAKKAEKKLSRIFIDLIHKIQ